MPISFSATRQKLAPTVTVSGALEIKTPVESGTKARFPVVINDFVQDSVALTGLSLTSGQPTVTGSAGAFANVRIGDVIVTANGTSDFASGTYVTAITNTTLTVSTNALAGRTNLSATIQSKTLDATVYILEIDNVVSGMNLTLTPKLYLMDGTKVRDVDNTGAYDEATVADGNVIDFKSISVDLETYFTQARRAKTNS